MPRTFLLTDGALYLGVMGQAAYLTDLSKPFMPAWAFVGVIVGPYVLYLLVPAEEFPGCWGRRLRWLGGIWYIATTTAVLVAFLADIRPEGWGFFLALILPGYAVSIRTMAARVTTGR